MALFLSHLQATRTSQAFQSKGSTALKGRLAPHKVSLVITGDQCKLLPRSDVLMTGIEQFIFWAGENTELAD